MTVPFIHRFCRYIVTLFIVSGFLDDSVAVALKNISYSEPFGKFVAVLAIPFLFIICSPLFFVTGSSIKLSLNIKSRTIFQTHSTLLYMKSSEKFTLLNPLKTFSESGALV